MTKTIYTVSVPITDQAQADRMLALCVEYGLPYSKNKIAFQYHENYGDYFRYTKSGYFGIYQKEDYTQVTEQEFIELLKSEKETSKTMTPAQIKAKELVDKFARIDGYQDSIDLSKCEFEKQCAFIAVEREIELVKKILDESTNIYQSLNTPKKLCVDILNPILKELEEVKQEIINL